MFELFYDIPREELAAFRHVAALQHFEPGDVIIREGSEAHGFYVLVKGVVEVYCETTQGETVLAHLSGHEVFGEMGLINPERLRTANVRASTHVDVFYIPADPYRLMQRHGDIESRRVLLRNTLYILRRRLAHNRPLDSAPRPSYLTWHDSDRRDADAALKDVQNQLKRTGVFKRVARERLEPGHVLCRQDELAQGFWFVHSGTLELAREPDRGREILLRHLHAPCLIGEIGFFTGAPRLATVRAADAIEVTTFDHGRYDDLWERDPETALELMLAAARLLVVTILAQRRPE